MVVEEKWRNSGKPSSRTRGEKPKIDGVEREDAGFEGEVKRGVDCKRNLDDLKGETNRRHAARSTRSDLAKQNNEMRRTQSTMGRTLAAIAVLSVLSPASGQTQRLFISQHASPASPFTPRFLSGDSSYDDTISTSRHLATARSARDLQNYQADDYYIQQGANAATANYDDDAAAAAMNARAEAQGDDGFFQVGDLDFDEISIMPVSCIN